MKHFDKRIWRRVEVIVANKMLMPRERNKLYILYRSDPNSFAFINGWSSDIIVDDSFKFR